MAFRQTALLASHVLVLSHIRGVLPNWRCSGRWDLNILRNVLARMCRLSVVGTERKDVLTVVEQLKQAGFICCVLSNTIALHWERLGSANEYPCLGLFDHIFASHLIGCAKPEKEAFWFVANALKVQMSECLLVDDTLLNVERAKAVGWRGILFTNTAQLQRDVSDLLQAPRRNT
jgi:FMN phosphatase YigB (HAD superfamily)